MARRGTRPFIEGHLPSQHESDWLALLVSGLSHIVVIVLVIALVRFREPPTPTAAQPRRAMQDTTIVYLPPPAPQPPPPPVVQQTPPPAEPLARARQLEKEENPNAQPEDIRREGREEQSSAPPVDESTGDPDATSSTPPIEEASALAVTMESEAQRIFGRRKGTPAADAGPVAVRPFENAREPDNNCPAIPRDSVTGQVPEGTVQGRVVDFDNGIPLRGAHLQMVGQPYNTFADNNGNFVLKFDLTLMENCRVQLVRISSFGHRDQTLPIVMGGGVSTVPLRKK